jgi:RNA polymerase sigma-70 factor (ECF subfamily)
MASCRPWLRERAMAQLPRELARKEDGSDLVQECQYLAAVQIEKFRGRSLGEFRAWLAGILRRRVLRKQRFWGEKCRDRAREQPLAPAENQSAALAATSTSMLQRLSKWEECQQLKLAANWCHEEDLSVISLHLFQGRSHEEIAAGLGITSATARQRYCRAVRRVGEAMQLLELMTKCRIDGPRQDVIGLYRFQGADCAAIARRLRLPEALVQRWIAEARPLFRAMAREGP